MISSMMRSLITSSLRSPARASLLAIPILAGCASGTWTAPVATPSSQYRAYGASITAGYGLSDPATQAYPSLVAAYENVASFANRAISGDQACDLPTMQMFPNGESPTLAAPATYSILVGTNDVEAKGAGPYETIYMLCSEATISWLAVPVEDKVLANGSGVTTTGTGAIDSSNHWNAWTTGGMGSSVSFTIVTHRPSPIYAWPRIDDNNPGTYTYALDGVVLGAASTRTTPTISTQNGSTNSLGFLRLPAVAAGTHVVTFTQTSGGANGVSIVGIGVPRGPGPIKLPTVLVGTLTYQWHGSSGGPCTIATPDPCEEYNNDIEGEVNLLSGDGLDVRLFDTRKYMFGTASEMIDALHPNALGQMELSHAVEASW